MEIFYLLNISQLSKLLSGQGLEMVCSVDLGPEVCPIIHVRVHITHLVTRAGTRATWRLQ